MKKKIFILFFIIFTILLINSDNKLFDAAKKNQLYLIKQLIKNGEDINSNDDDGNSILIIATKNNNYDLIKYLYNYTPNLEIDLNIINKNNESVFTISKDSKKINDFYKNWELINNIMLEFKKLNNFNIYGNNKMSMKNPGFTLTYNSNNIYLSSFLFIFGDIKNSIEIKINDIIYNGDIIFKDKYNKKNRKLEISGKNINISGNVIQEIINDKNDIYNEKYTYKLSLNDQILEGCNYKSYDMNFKIVECKYNNLEIKGYKFSRFESEKYYNYIYYKFNDRRIIGRNVSYWEKGNIYLGYEFNSNLTDEELALYFIIEWHLDFEYLFDPD